MVIKHPRRGPPAATRTWSAIRIRGPRMMIMGIYPVRAPSGGGRESGRAQGSRANFKLHSNLKRTCIDEVARETYRESLVCTAERETEEKEKEKK